MNTTVEIDDELDLYGDLPDDVVVSVNDCYKIYKAQELEVVALSGVSLQILEGKIMAVVGPALHQATDNVLKQQTDPVSAANQAIESLVTP